MRFWVTKNSELPVHDQLVRQVLLGIMSQELAPGQKLPSVRAIARLYKIHANTVSTAYHELLERGWLELRRGSGLYVRPLKPSDAHDDLDTIVAQLLQATRTKGFEPEEVLSRLEHWVRPRTFDTIFVADTEPAMREILQAEIAEHVSGPVKSIDEIGARCGRSVVVALATRLPVLRGKFPPDIPCIPLRLRSVRGALEGQARPSRDVLVSIVSFSSEIRLWSRAMLLAVGLDPECLCEIDPSVTGWRDRLALGGLVVTDVVTGRQLPDECHARVYRVIADSSIAELKRVAVPLPQ